MVTFPLVATCCKLKSFANRGHLAYPQPGNGFLQGTSGRTTRSLFHPKPTDALGVSSRGGDRKRPVEIHQPETTEAVSGCSDEGKGFKPYKTALAEAMDQTKNPDRVCSN